MSTLERGEESLLNEYKGNVFEFLVAQSLSKKFNIEESFLTNINSDMMSMLMVQQKFISDKASNLLVDLPILSEKLVDDLCAKLAISNVVKVELCGKIALGMHDDQMAEADIIITTSERTYPVSIKLNKFGSYVNTKSAGLKSCLSKYFSIFTESKKLQSELNQFIEFDFERLMRSMFEYYDLTFDGNLNEWKKQNLPERPGELPEVLRTQLHHHYFIVSKEISKMLHILIAGDKDKFIKCLLPLMGASREDIIHATCLYQKKDVSHTFKACEILNLHTISDSSCIILKKKESASIEIEVVEHILQLRVKPMKTFIGGGFKLNCAIKPIN